MKIYIKEKNKKILEWSNEKINWYIECIIEEDFLEKYKSIEWFTYKDWGIFKENKVLEEREKNMNLRKIKKEISETNIDFKWGKFKIRKKDLWEISAYFEYGNEMKGLPINVLDSEYNTVSMTYNDFVEFGKLVWSKKMEIAKKYK